MKIESFKTIRKRNFAEILKNFLTAGHLVFYDPSPPPLLSTVFSRLIFVFGLSQLSGPDYLGVWNRLFLEHIFWL